MVIAVPNRHLDPRADDDDDGDDDEMGPRSHDSFMVNGTNITITIIVTIIIITTSNVQAIWIWIPTY